MWVVLVVKPRTHQSPPGRSSDGVSAGQDSCAAPTHHAQHQIDARALCRPVVIGAAHRARRPKPGIDAAGHVPLPEGAVRGLPDVPRQGRNLLKQRVLR